MRHAGREEDHTVRRYSHSNGGITVPSKEEVKVITLGIAITLGLGQRVGIGMVVCADGDGDGVRVT